MEKNQVDLTNLIDQLISPFTAGFVTLALLGNPSMTDAYLVSKVEGDLRHFLRGRLGWVVDVLWSITEVKSELDRVVSAQVAASRAADGGLSALLPPVPGAAPGATTTPSVTFVPSAPVPAAHPVNV